MEISRVRLLLGLGLGIVAASFASIFIRLAQAEGVATLAIAAWRLVLVSAILLPYAGLTRRVELRSLRGRDLFLLAIAGVFLGLHFATWIASLGYTSVASAAVLVAMGPAFVAVISWVFLGEKPSLLLGVGIGLAVAGSVVISWGDFGLGGEQLLGDLLALAGAAMVAGYLLVGRRVRGRLSLAAYVAIVYGVGMVTMLVVVALARVPLLGYSPAGYAWVLALALGPQLIGHSVLNWALRYLTATFVAIVTLAEPIGSSVLAYMLLGERVGAVTLLGAGLVLGGIYLASRAELAPVTEAG